VPSLLIVGLGPVVARARFFVHEILDRGAQAVSRGGARRASQVLGRGSQADARGAAQVLDRGAQADALGAAQVLDRGAQAAARAAARCAPQVLDRCARPLPAVPLVVCRR
jgi:hypothetical protein